MRTAALLSLLPLSLAVSTLAAQNDITNGADHPLLPRVEGYYVSSYSSNEPEIERFRRARDGSRDSIEGRITRMRYSFRRGQSRPAATGLAIARHYQGLVERYGGTILFQSQYHELGARFVRDNREYWVMVTQENATEYNVTIAERPAPAVAAAPAAPEAGPGGAAPMRRPGMVPRGTRAPRLTAPPRLNLAPTIVSFAPTARQSGEVLRIAGTNLQRPTAVRFVDTRGNAWPAQVYAYEACSDNLRVLVPSLPAGQYFVTVSSAFGTGQSSAMLGVFQTPINEPPDAMARLRAAMRRIVDEYQRRGMITPATGATLMMRISGGQITSLAQALDALHDAMVADAEAAIGGRVAESVILIALRTGRPPREIAALWRHCHAPQRTVGVGGQGGIARAGVGIGDPPAGEGQIWGGCGPGTTGQQWHSHVTPMSISNAAALNTAITRGTSPGTLPAHYHTDAGFAAGTVWYASITDDDWFEDFVNGSMEAAEWAADHMDTVISVAKITGYVIVGTVGCVVGVVFSAGAGCVASVLAVAGPIAKETAKILVEEEVVTVDGVDKQTMLAGINAIPIG